MQPREWLMHSQTESNYSSTPFTCALFDSRTHRFIQASLWCHADMSWGRFWCGSWQNFNMNLFILNIMTTLISFLEALWLPTREMWMCFCHSDSRLSVFFGIGSARGDLRPLKTAASEEMHWGQWSYSMLSLSHCFVF